MLPKNKEMPLRYCQINSYKANYVNRKDASLQGVQDDRLLSTYMEYNCTISDEEEEKFEEEEEEEEEVVYSKLTH